MRSSKSHEEKLAAITDKFLDGIQESMDKSPSDDPSRVLSSHLVVIVNQSTRNKTLSRDQLVKALIDIEIARASTSVAQFKEVRSPESYDLLVSSAFDT